MLITNFMSVDFFNNFNQLNEQKESDGHFRNMTKTTIHILMVLWFSFAGVHGQDVILADQTDGCDTLTVQFTLDHTDPEAFYKTTVWNFGDGVSTAGGLTITHRYNEPGVYSVSCVINNGARIVTATDLIRIGATPYADFSFEDKAPSGTEFQYQFQAKHFEPVTGIDVAYTWRFPDGTEVFDSFAEYNFPADSIYQVYLLIEDAVGCKDTIFKKIPVSKELLVPNVFSPNGDEINDYFEVTTPGDYRYSFRVFSEAGLQVYYSMSPLIRWDGRTIGGQEAPPGVYFYVIQSDETPTETSLSGFFYLFR
jgi:gliding motility-associated-like protein